MAMSSAITLFCEGLYSRFKAIELSEENRKDIFHAIELGVQDQAK